METSWSQIGGDEVDMNNAIKTSFMMQPQAVEHGHQATEPRFQRRIIGVREAAELCFAKNASGCIHQAVVRHYWVRT